MKKFGILMLAGSAVLFSGFAHAAEKETEVIVVQPSGASEATSAAGGAPQQEVVEKPIVIQPSTPQVVPGNAVVIPSDRVRMSVRRDAITGEVLSDGETVKTDKKEKESLRDRVRDKIKE